MTEQMTTTIPTLYKLEDINWNELEEWGIHRDELIRDGHMDALLKGEKTEVIHLIIMHSGAYIITDATLQIIEIDGKPIIEVVGLDHDIENNYQTYE